MTRSRWSAELGALAAQACVEMLAVWMLCAVVQHMQPAAMPWTFAHAWLLQFAAASAAWFIQRLQLPPVRQAWLLLVAGVSLLWSWLGLVLAVPVADEPARLWAGAIGSYLCVRGISSGLRSRRAGETLRWFRLGGGFVVVWSAFLALSGTPRAELPMPQLYALSLGYFTLGALWTGSDQRRSALARVAQAAPLSSTALLAVAGPVFACAALTVLPTAGSQDARKLAHGGFALFQLLQRHALAMLGAAGNALKTFLRWLGSLWAAHPVAKPALRGPIPAEPTWSPLLHLEPLAPQAGSHVALVFVMLALAVIVLVHVLRGFSRRRDDVPVLEARGGLTEVQSSTWSWRMLWQPLHKLYSRTRIRRRSDIHPPRRRGAPASVREVYRALLGWAAARGMGRRPGQTAHELVVYLAREFPAKARALTQLEGYYALARYAEREPAAPQLEHARALLDDVTEVTAVTGTEASSDASSKPTA